MLTERIVGEQDLIVIRIRHHVVGPMDHDRGGEGERALADAQRVAGFDRPVVVIGTVMRREALQTMRVARDDGGVRGELHHARNSPRVILLDMVGHDVFDP